MLDVPSILKEGFRGEYMAHDIQPQSTSNWGRTIREAAGALVVAAIIATFTLGGTAWFSLVRLDNDVAILKRAMDEGGRYTLEMANTHQAYDGLINDRFERDIEELKEEVEKLEQSVNTHDKGDLTKQNETNLLIQKLLLKMEVLEQALDSAHSK